MTAPGADEPGEGGNPAPSGTAQGARDVATAAMDDYRAPVSGAEADRRHAATLAAVSAPGAGDPTASPRNRLAAEVRRIIAATVSAQLSEEAVVEAAHAAQRLADQLQAAAGESTMPRRQPSPDQSPQDFFPTSPVIGYGNPLAPPVVVTVVDGPDGGPPEIRGHAHFDYPYEGPPTCVHGGVIAETFDEILGAANIAAGNPGLTGTLTVRYRKPTPLRTDLRIEGRYMGRDGRKIRTWGGIFHGDVLTAEAEGTFIEIMPKQFLAIAEGNAEVADPVILAAIKAEVERQESE